MQIIFKIITMLICLTGTLFASQIWEDFYSDFENEPEVQVINSNSDNVEIDIEIKGMYIEDIIHNSILYQKLEIPGWQNMGIPGEPNVPI